MIRSSVSKISEVNFFEIFEKIRRAAQFQNTISFELVVKSVKVKYLSKGKKQQFKSDIIFVIWVNFWVVTF